PHLRSTAASAARASTSANFNAGCQRNPSHGRLLLQPAGVRNHGVSACAENRSIRSADLSLPRWFVAGSPPMSADPAAQAETDVASVRTNTETLPVVSDPPGHSKRRGWGAWVWCLIPALGLVELGAQLSVSHSAPDQAEWAALRPRLKELKQPSDLVVVAPEWAGVNARHALGDELMPLKGLARPDETAFPRAIEVSALGEHSHAVAGWLTLETHRVGPFTLTIK